MFIASVYGQGADSFLGTKGLAAGLAAWLASLGVITSFPEIASLTRICDLASIKARVDAPQVPHIANPSAGNKATLQALNLLVVRA